VSDEGEKEAKMEENQENKVYGRMKRRTCVSLCCTKQSHATHLSLHLSIWKMKGRVEEEEREREGWVMERKSGL